MLDDITGTTFRIVISGTHKHVAEIPSYPLVQDGDAVIVEAQDDGTIPYRRRDEERMRTLCCPVGSRTINARPL